MADMAVRQVKATLTLRVEIEVSPSMSFDAAHDMIGQRVRAAFDCADVLRADVQVLPYGSSSQIVEVTR